MPRRRPRISLFAFVVFACVAAVLAYIIHFISIVGIGTPKYVDNVYVNGMSFAGMTKEEAMAQVQSLENEWLSETYTLQYQNYSWTFTRAQVGADALYESPMEQAWNLGQIGSVFQRKARIQRLEKNPSYLNVAITYDESLLDSFIRRGEMVMDHGFLYPDEVILRWRDNNTIEMNDGYHSAEDLFS